MKHVKNLLTGMLMGVAMSAALYLPLMKGMF
jgi:hypothetical protein